MPILSEMVATTAQIRARRELTHAELLLAASLAEELIDTLELKLNRWLYPRQTTEQHTITSSGRLLPYRGPVVSVESIGYVAGFPAQLPAYPTRLLDVADAWTPGAVLEITYTAGEIPGPAIIGALGDVVARTLIAPVQAATGMISSYSVEGTSITYGPGVSGDSGGGAGRITVGQLSSFRRLRRRVLVI